MNSDLSGEVTAQENTQGECVFNRKCVFKAEGDESTSAPSDRKRVDMSSKTSSTYLKFVSNRNIFLNYTFLYAAVCVCMTVCVCACVHV